MAGTGLSSVSEIYSLLPDSVVSALLNINATPTDGQLYIGSSASGGRFVLATLTGSRDLVVAVGSGTITLTTPFASGQKLLGYKLGANFNSTADQALTMATTLTKYVVRKIIVTNASVNLTTAAGGVYTAASKGGTAVVANTQIYTALTASTKFIDLTIAAAAATDVVTAAQLYLALTTAQGSAATADIYVFGDDLS